MMRVLPFLFCLAGLAGLRAQDAVAQPASAAKVVKTDGYPLDTCVVSNEDLDDSAKVFKVEGHTFKTCCKKCQAKVEKDPKPYIAKLEEAVTKAQAPTYALTTCPVSGETLDADAVSVVVDNTLVKLCCDHCKDKLMADPAKFVAKVQAAAVAKQSAHYTAKTCPVSGHDLDDKAVTVMHGTTMVKLCCEDCVDKFKATPNAMAAKVAPKAPNNSDAKTDAGKPEKANDHKGAHGDGKAPAAMATPGAMAATGGAACCETGKPEAAGCCQGGGGGCCQTEAAKPSKSECCETGATAGKTEAKATEVKAEAKGDAKTEKKLN